MSFEAVEESRTGGQPAELYLFRYGPEPDAFFAYTNFERNLIVENVEYLALPISRDSVKASGTLDKAALSVRMPRNTRLGDLFKVYAPSYPISLVIRQGHVSDPDAEYLAIWSGRVLSSERNGPEAEFLCEPVGTAMNRVAFRANYQLSCRHVLYGNRCKADKAAATVTHNVVNLTGTTVTFADNWNGAIDAQKYVTGMLEWSTPAGPERRMILGVTDGKTLQLAGPTTGIVAGAAVDVVLGCNHRETDCINLHGNNINNFGGMPWIPLESPINTNPFS